MSQRNIPAQLETDFSGRHVELFVLIEMQLTSGTLYITSTAFDVDWGGHTWLCTHGLGSVSTVKESSGQITGLTFSMSGVPLSMFALALTERIFRRPVIVRLVSVGPSGTLTVDPSAWTGELDMFQINDEGKSLELRVTAEHRMMAWQNPKLVNFSDAEQRLLSSTDTFYSRLSAMANKTIIWPKKEFFKQ